MSEPQEAPAAQPEATDPPADPKLSPAADPSPEPPKASADEDPKWLDKRLEQAKNSAQSDLLKSLGVGSLDDAKEALQTLQQLKDEKLSEQERTAKQLEELKPQAQRAAALEKTLSGYAEQAIGKLTEEQAAAVKGIAGEDPAQILDTITKLAPTWKAAAPPAAPERTPEPKDTAPQGGPPDTGNQSPVDFAAEYERVKQTNPFEAADILRAHPEILSAGG